MGSRSAATGHSSPRSVAGGGRIQKPRCSPQHRRVRFHFMVSAGTTHRSRSVELYGLLACVRLTAFEQRAADAGRAASYEDTVVLGGLATGAFAHFELLRDRLIEAGADPYEAMRPFQEAITAFHERTRPADAMEALTKVYVADSVVGDLYL